jgi:aldehyde:ferredoxin oxidoreductase
MEFGNIITWLQDAYRTGLLTDKDTGLEMSKLGTLEFVEQLLSIITRREGIGKFLAEGLLRAGETLGDDAKALFGENVGDVGLGTAYTPREYITTALLWALAPRQPISELHEISYPIARWLFHLLRPQKSPTSAKVFRAQAEKFWGGGESWNLTSYEDKALAALKIQDRTVVRDSLVLCEAAYPIMDSFNSPDNVGDPALENKIFSAVTGIETSEEDLYVYGKRIYNLQRSILLREGWKPKEDDYPPEYNFTEPMEMSSINPKMIVPGLTEEEPLSFRGNVLDRGKYETMRDEYYELRGWDAGTGLQTAANLNALDMADVAEELKNRDLLG